MRKATFENGGFVLHKVFLPGSVCKFSAWYDKQGELLDAEKIDGAGRELIYRGACLSREQARRYGEKNMPRDLRRAGFKAHVFESDPQIHGAHYFRVTYGKEC